MKPFKQHFKESIQVPRAWDKKKRAVRVVRPTPGINIWAKNKIMKHVQEFVADAASEGGGLKENAWTLAIDFAKMNLKLQDAEAIATAKAACKELGYK